MSAPESPDPATADPKEGLAGRPGPSDDRRGWLESPHL